MCFISVLLIFSNVDGQFSSFYMKISVSFAAHLENKSLNVYEKEQFSN
jgi:hypothetical protein